MKQLTFVLFFLFTAVTITAVTNTWDGSSSTAWSTGANWSQNHYPTASEDVVIPITMSGRYPIVTGSYSCNTVNMEIGTSLEIGNGTLNITGGLTSQGNLKLTNELAVLNVQDMTFNSGSTMYIPYNGSELNISDDVYFNAGSNINPTYGNFKFSGGSPSITANVSTSIYNLISNSTNLRHVAGVGDLTIKGNLTVNSSYSYVGLADAETLIYGAVFVGTGGNLQFNAGMVVLKGNNTTITTRSGNYFNNLFINKTAGFGVTLNSNIDVNGNLTIYYNSSLTAGVYDITLGGNWTNWGGTNGYIAYIADYAIVTFDGAANQTINDSEYFDWFVINKTGGHLTIAEGVTIECYYYDWIAGNLTVYGNFIVNNMNDQAIYGILNVYGTMELHQSDADPINIYGVVTVLGVLNIYSGSNTSFGSSGGALFLNGGTVDFKNCGFTMHFAFVCQVFSGIIRMTGSLIIDNSPAIVLDDGTIEMYGTNSSNIICNAGTQLNNLVINKSGGARVYVNSALDINGNLEIINSGILTTYSHAITVGGNFTVSSTAQVEAANGTLHMDGTSSQWIMGTAAFGTFILDNYSAYVYFNNANFTCNSYHWLNGNLDIAYSTFTANDLANDGIYGGFFVHNTSIVNLHQDVFSSINCGASIGITANCQLNIYGGNAPAVFYGTLLMSSGVLDVIDRGIIIDSNCSVDITGGLIRTSSSFSNNLPSYNTTNCTLELYGSSDAILTMNYNTPLYNLIINKTGLTVVDAATNINVFGNLIVSGGIFSTPNNMNVMGNVDIYGYLRIHNCTLRLMENKSLTVFTGGGVILLGSESTYATVTGYAGMTGFYSFTVNSGGTIYANWVLFEYMNTNGINVQNGAVVNEDWCFNHCQFRNGAPGGTLLTINNSQDLTLFDVSFPNNTWGGSYNVMKTINQGSINFVLYMGVFGGAAYEADPYDRIRWNQMQVPPVENLTISRGISDGMFYLNWDYPIGEATYKIYQAVAPEGPYYFLVNSAFKYITLGSTHNHIFFRVTAILEP